MEEPLKRKEGFPTLLSSAIECYEGEGGQHHAQGVGKHHAQFPLLKTYFHVLLKWFLSPLLLV